jgi:hypothetical protein
VNQRCAAEHHANTPHAAGDVNCSSSWAGRRLPSALKDQTVTVGASFEGVCNRRVIALWGQPQHTPRCQSTEGGRGGRKSLHSMHRPGLDTFEHACTECKLAAITIARSPLTCAQQPTMASAKPGGSTVPASRCSAVPVSVVMTSAAPLEVLAMTRDLHMPHKSTVLHNAAEWTHPNATPPSVRHARRGLRACGTAKSDTLRPKRFPIHVGSAGERARPPVQSFIFVLKRPNEPNRTDTELPNRTEPTWRQKPALHPRGARTLATSVVQCCMSCAENALH